MDNALAIDRLDSSDDFSSPEISFMGSVFRSSYHNWKKTATEPNRTGKKPNRSVAVIQFLEIISCSCLNLGSKKNRLQLVTTGYFRGI
jgi:hypothetical protein